MLGSVRVAVPRVIPRSAPLARSIATKGDRWTPAVARDAQQVLEGPNALELNKVLPNIEAMWPKMAREEQYSVYKLLEEVQRKDWKELTVDEKKGGTYKARPQRLTLSLLCVVRPARPAQAHYAAGPEHQGVHRYPVRRGSRCHGLLRRPLDRYVSDDPPFD